LTYAVVAEAQAIEALQTGWAPYDNAPWDAFLAEREQSDFLRRQVRSSLDELNLQFGIAAGG
jgi:hypothetical protein